MSHVRAFMPRLPALAMSLALLAPEAALAVSARGSSAVTDLRDGALVARPATKVSSVNFPLLQDASQNISPTVPNGGVAGTTQATIGFGGNIDFVADPGDPPNATLCVRYRFRGQVAGVVDAPTASVAGGVGSSVGFTTDNSVQPVTIAMPNPLELILTPGVGPAQTIFSASPQSFVQSTVGGNAASITRRGTFLVRAGDNLTWQFTTASVARAEPPAAQARITTSEMQFSLGDCTLPVVPAVSPPGLAALAALLAFAAMMVGRRRRARAG